MAEVTKEEVQSYSIAGLTSIEFEVLTACLAVAKTNQLYLQLEGDGLRVPKNRIAEIALQLWEDVSEGR
jgi:hypothetical protein